MSVARKLAQFIVATSVEDLPPKAVDHAKIAIANTIASAAAGSQKESVEIIRKLVVERGGVAEATIWGDTGPKTHVSDAARMNAMMSDAAAMDDSHLKCSAHPATVAAPAAVAMGERTGASGKEVLCAVALGYEIAGRVGEPISPFFIEERGIHNCIISVFAGAVAAGKVLGLQEDEMTQTIVLAATSMGGLAGSRWTPAREYHAGLSGMHSIYAALSALHGYTAEENILEAKQGFFLAYGDNVDVAEVTRGLGEEWDIVTEMALKLIPGMHGMHALVEAAITAAKAGNVQPEEVERITVAGSPQLKDYSLMLYPKEHTTAILSLPYYMAACVVDKEFSWHHVSPEKINDPIIGSLQEKVKLEIVPGRSVHDYPRGGTVTIATKAGKEYSHTVDWPKGSPQRGVAWSDLDAKYRALVPKSNLSSDRIEESLQMLHDLDHVAHIAELTALLQR